ncbi:MAG: NUDIX domain-containing protein [Candidatus Thorarchaeota archaeon]
MMSRRRYPETPIPSIAAVVVGPKGILLKRRDKPPYKGLWNILSGVIKTGETQEEAVVREVREETGLNADVIRFLDTSDVITTDSDGKVEYHFMVNVYLLRVSSDSGHLVDGTAGIRWFHPESIPAEDMPGDVSRALQAIKEQLLQVMQNTRM